MVRNPTPDELSALKAAEPNVALTPGLRNAIAAAVQKARLGSPYGVADAHVTNATVSDIKFVIPNGGSVDNALPYYCVHVEAPGTLFNHDGDYTALVSHPEPNRYVVKVEWSKTQAYTRCTNVKGQAFPELVQLMNTSEEVRAANRARMFSM
jgi:hypothetical protein